MGRFNAILVQLFYVSEQSARYEASRNCPYHGALGGTASVQTPRFVDTSAFRLLCSVIFSVACQCQGCWQCWHCSSLVIWEGSDKKSLFLGSPFSQNTSHRTLVPLFLQQLGNSLMCWNQIKWIQLTSHCILLLFTWTHALFIRIRLQDPILLDGKCETPSVGLKRALVSRSHPPEPQGELITHFCSLVTLFLVRGSVSCLSGWWRADDLPGTMAPPPHPYGF